MWLPSITLGRLLTFTAAGVMATAVLLGRHNPSPAEVRRPAPPRHRAVPDNWLSITDSNLRVLDAETGTVVQVPLTGTDIIRFAVCSPWRDGRGRTHVAGVWKELDGPFIRRMGLARCVLPGGEILDRVELNIVPLCAPCWPPGTGTWVLFAGANGVLYRLAFDEAAAQPRPLDWRCRVSRGGPVRVEEPTWPSDSRLAGTIVAVLRYGAPDGGAPTEWDPRELWWLKLNPDSTAVEDAGRLIAGAPAGQRGETVWECSPTLSATPDGGLALAYLTRHRGEFGYRLRLAPVTIDGATGVPRVEPAAAVEVARGRVGGPLAFSNDGRWLYSFPDRSAPYSSPDRSPLPRQADRCSVVEALAGRTAWSGG